jgi:hypothetical protein
VRMRALEGPTIIMDKKSEKPRTLALPLAILVSVALAGRGVALACNSPLLLDLNGDGIRTTTGWYPVHFDFDGDGTKEITAWTAPDGDEGFLWLDLNANGVVDSGRELFGDSTLLPTGETSQHGFEALAVYDRYELGGNDDGLITDGDLIWRFLRLWIDRNHDGVSQRQEIRHLSAEGVLSISLVYVEARDYDDAENLHLYQSTFVRRVTRQFGRPYSRTQEAHDVYFLEAAP